MEERIPGYIFSSTKKMELLSFLLTGGEVFDSKVAIDLLKTVDLTDKTVLADRTYGASDIRDYICERTAFSCISDKVNSPIKHLFDKEIYKQRNIVERFFYKIKNNRRIATRYDKLLMCFCNFVILAAIRIKLN